MAQFSFLQPAEWGPYAEDIRRLFGELAQQRTQAGQTAAGTYQPLLDVFETADAIELVLDACGMAPSSLRVLYRGGVVVVAGEKLPAPPSVAHAFHQVERDFGRFARVVQLSGAFDIEQARASLAAGELTILIPKRSERRGQPRRIAITLGGGRPS